MQKAAEETKTEPTESCDADFKWFSNGVYRLGNESTSLDIYYVFSDNSNGRINTVSGIGVAFDAAAYADAQAQYNDDGQNPVTNFIGNYSNGRAMMNVSAKGKNEAAVTIAWGFSASETTTWNMSGTVMQVGNTLVMQYDNCNCESFLFNDDGTRSLSVTDYTNGCVSITFEDDQAVWADFEQDGAGCQVFSFTSN